MDRNITRNQKDTDPAPGKGSSQEETPEARSERYRRKVEALNDCMLE
ncbi:MAG: hypothetical protein WCP36_01250 [Methanomicrobiales archaeon]